MASNNKYDQQLDENKRLLDEAARQAEHASRQLDESDKQFNQAQRQLDLADEQYSRTNNNSMNTIGSKSTAMSLRNGQFAFTKNARSN